MAPWGSGIYGSCSPSRNYITDTGCASFASYLIPYCHGTPANSRSTMTAYGAVIGWLIGVLGLSLRVWWFLKRRHVRSIRWADTSKKWRK